MNNESKKPVLLYFTSTDEKLTQKIQSYEDAVLCTEKVCIAAKFFDCYQVDVTDIEDDHPIHKLVKNPKPLTVYTLFGGKIIYASKVKPSSSSIFSICSKTLKKVFKVSLEKIAKEEERLLTALEKVDQEKEKIDKIRLQKGRKLSRKEDVSLQKKEQDLFEKYETLKKAEKALLDLEQHLPKKKETAKV